MGTPDFAVPAFQAIVDSRHEILAVVTGPDVARGRGCLVQSTPVKCLALNENLPVFQPVSLKDPELHTRLREIQTDLYVVVAFRILPPEMIAIPRLGAINLHASLLPKYRGAAPIHWALINGERATGVTVFQIKSTVDTGDILLQERIDIQPDDTYGTLSPRLAESGARLLVKALDGLTAGTIRVIPQDNDAATPAPKIYPEMGKIDWSKPAEEIKFLIHGLSPIPGAYTFFGDRRLKILKATFENNVYPDVPGTIVCRQKAGLAIQTGRGLLKPTELQLEGRKPLSIAEFLCGFSGQVGDRFAS